ncbi:LTR copia-type gag-polypeptide [Tanacetum coccineum]
MTTSKIAELSTHTYFPIKLTTNNFPSWRKQVLSTLMGLELEQFVDGQAKAPPKILEEKANPDYRLCVSRSRIISLQSKLDTNSKGTKPVAEYLNEMKTIADELALAQKLIDDDDLIVHKLTHLVKGNPMKEKILLNVNSGTESEIMCSIASHPLRETRQQGGETSFSYEADVKKWSSQDFSFAFSIFRKEVVFLLDISASMQDDPLEKSKDVVLGFLLELNQEVTLNIIAFNGEVVRS